jgi:hypothetical protein
MKSCRRTSEGSQEPEARSQKENRSGAARLIWEGPRGPGLPELDGQSKAMAGQRLYFGFWLLACGFWIPSVTDQRAKPLAV